MPGMNMLYGGLLTLALGTAAADAPQGSAPSIASLPAASPGNARPAAATPAAGAYNVELVVCRFTAALGGSEDWAGEAPGPAAGPAGDSDAGSGGRFVKLLGMADLQLNDVESRLRANGTCVPVAHFGWEQLASPWGSHDVLDLAQLGAAPTGLTGTAQLMRGEFLHLALSLSLQIDTPPASLGAAPGTVFTLRDNHRVRFYERNYYDSPAFGVIALVTPAQGRRPGR
jgi:hypothetical protein